MSVVVVWTIVLVFVSQRVTVAPGSGAPLNWIVPDAVSYRLLGGIGETGIVAAGAIAGCKANQCCHSQNDSHVVHGFAST